MNRSSDYKQRPQSAKPRRTAVNYPWSMESLAAEDRFTEHQTCSIRCHHVTLACFFSKVPAAKLLSQYGAAASHGLRWIAASPIRLGSVWASLEILYVGCLHCKQACCWLTTGEAESLLTCKPSANTISGAAAADVPTSLSSSKCIQRKCVHAGS